MHLNFMEDIMVTKIRTYSELMKYDTFLERFRYLKLDGQVGRDTFGFDRYLNQVLYNCDEWKEARRETIIRDSGCDLGIEGREIHKGIIVHHMNPITVDDVLSRNPKIFDTEFLITTVLRTHNAIHFSNEDVLIAEPITRRKNDTIPWR